MSSFFLSSVICLLSLFLPEPVKPHDFAAATVRARRVRRHRSNGRGRRQRFRLGFPGGPLGCGACWFFAGGATAGESPAAAASTVSNWKPNWTAGS